MTKDESIAAFNALFTSQEIDPVAVENFRTAMTEDYDKFTVTTTTNTSLQSKIDELVSTNTKLRDTNLQLIMMHPQSSNSNESNSDDTDTVTQEPTDEEKQEALDKVIAGFKRG